MEKHLHIIDFTVPYPVDYGGVFDLFYKLPALQSQGVKIHLHCFDYGRGMQPELYKYCETVKYYEREKPIRSLFEINKLPYIVASRKNEQLFENLLKDDYPIFMEGIHCSYLVNDTRFKNRRKFVRIHNVEYQYYKDLYKNTTSFSKKWYYWNESRMLQQYEKQIVDKATAFWGVTHKDVDTFRNEFGCKTIDFLSLYLPPNWQVKSLEGIGHFCLYQGDLSVPVNEKAAIWLLEKVFSKCDIPFVVAGKNPSDYLQKLAHKNMNTCIVANPSDKEMQDLIAKAHINILPSYHATGIKLKLLNALYNGRHCLVNDSTVLGTGLEPACHIANTADAFLSVITQLQHLPFAEEEIALRKKLLSNMFNNEANAKQQVKWIWG
ncbi:MAG: glycosyltransferase [Chitinophagaceae bacterium]